MGVLVHGSQLAPQAAGNLCRQSGKVVGLIGGKMRRENDWLKYLHFLSEQGRDQAQHASVYAAQWAHDVRCIRQGVEHRRVGGAAVSQGHDEWLQAGYVVRQPSVYK
jgi:hypothetical protein